MNVHEAADYLTERGYRCRACTVRALAKAGKLNGYRIGVGRRGPLAFSETQLDAFLQDAQTGTEASVRRKAKRRPVSIRPVKAAPAPAGGGGWRDMLREVQGA